MNPPRELTAQKKIIRELQFSNSFLTLKSADTAGTSSDSVFSLSEGSAQKKEVRLVFTIAINLIPNNDYIKRLNYLTESVVRLETKHRKRSFPAKS